MEDPLILAFESFRVDLRDERLWREDEAIRVTNKSFAVLQHLLEHPSRLVTKDALLNAVWSTTYVSEAALAMCIRELRKALGDDAKAPRFIETVRGRGYRFIAPVKPAEQPATVRGPYQQQRTAPIGPGLDLENSALVGRERELTRLRE